ncbi:O-antigen ligase family protein [Aquisalimonas sp.]|uniref:O-antigen ligase family protein n=1 Tax=Aquisalimonas sp. TaxID=1872621 RepID=UPI0025C3C919|nr:O-antigen ligase family protein [Aquisalimonas sp.]
MLLLFAASSWREIGHIWHAGWAARVLILLSGYVLIQGALVAWGADEPGFSAGDLQHMLRTVSLGTLVVGWAVYASRFSPRVLCTLALLGFTLATLQAFLQHGPELFEIRRMHFLRSPNEVGLFGGTLTLGAALLGGSYTVGRWRAGRPWTACVVAILSVVLLAFGLWLWIQSGSRSTWVGLVGAAVVVGGGALVGAMVARQHLSSTLVAVLAGAIILGGFIAYQYDSVAARFQRELPSVQTILSGDFGKLQTGRAEGHNPRFKIWAVALEEIRERPVFGHGSGAVTAGIQQAVDDGRLSDRRSHFHSLYLHLAVFLGVPAVMLWVGSLASITARAFRRLRGGLAHDPGLAWFVLAWGVFFAITSLFQVRMHSAYGAAYFILFSGLAFGFYLQAKESSHHDTRPTPLGDTPTASAHPRGAGDER